MIVSLDGGRLLEGYVSGRIRAKFTRSRGRAMLLISMF